jgi:hypothetical protein
MTETAMQDARKTFASNIPLDDSVVEELMIFYGSARNLIFSTDCPADFVSGNIIWTKIGFPLPEFMLIMFFILDR